MKKKAWLLKRVFMISLVSYFFMLPITNVTGGWDCNYIYITDKTDEASNTLTYTISLQETPNPLTTGTLTIGFDPSQLTFDHSDTIGCLPFDSTDIILQNPGELIVIRYTLGEPVPSGSSGCFCIITFTINQGVPDPEHPFIAGISDDFCPPDNGCWCTTPMKCHVEITPTYESILSEETIQFSAENVYCDDSYEPSYEWSILGNCNSTIEPDTGTPVIYTGGEVEGFCQDTVRVTDTDATNGSTAAARVDISPSVTISANPLLPCKTIIGSGASATFEATNKFCNSTPIYTWSVETSIGSTISPGSAIDAKGNYQAGREFSSCDDVQDTIKVEAQCPENSIIRHGETNKVTIPACTVTINPSNPTVASYQTVQFEATLDDCCNTPPDGPLYTWSIVTAIGSTVYNSGLYKAGHNNNVKKATDTIKVTTTAFCTITHNVKVTVNPPQCKTSAECNDGIYCNGIEMCIREKCYPGNDRCLDDGLYCNGKESCDENNDKCLSSGDPCPPDLSCNEASDACGCLTNEDCDNDVFCDGAETCVEGVCQAGTNPCVAPTPKCVEENETCEPVEIVVCETSIEPATAEVVSGQTISFVATHDEEKWEGCKDPVYEWSIESTIGSKIDQNGIYTAGINLNIATPATDKVKVADQENGTEVEATITVSLCPSIQLYGEHSEEVETLRNFRDNILSTTPEGQELIRLYYELSPVISKAMRENHEFKEEVKGIVDAMIPLLIN